MFSKNYLIASLIISSTATYANQPSPQQLSDMTNACRTYINTYSSQPNKIPPKEAAVISKTLSNCNFYGSCQNGLSDIPECAQKLNSLALSSALISPPNNDSTLKNKPEPHQQTQAAQKTATQPENPKTLLPSPPAQHTPKKQITKTPSNTESEPTKTDKPAETINWF